MDATTHPLAGLYKPLELKSLFYGPDCVTHHLLSCLPTPTSKAFIITGTSLATKTPLIQKLETLLTPTHHAGTFSHIREHAPVAQLDSATTAVQSDANIDTIISVGGGSPIDSAKAISFRVHATSGSFLTHIAIPTTLSAAECTATAGYTQSSGTKTAVSHPSLTPSRILYDPLFAAHTPPSLFASTGIRALDHAVELNYHATATQLCRAMTRAAIADLFALLPVYHSNPRDQDTVTRLFLAAYMSLGFLGQNVRGGLGLSHTLGYALGSPYGIPHGITSCLTLGHVVKVKARLRAEDAAAVAALMSVVGGERTGDDVRDAEEFGERVLGLVEGLGFKTTLTERGVGRDQVDVICKRATGGLSPGKEMGKEDEETLKAVRALVESLY